MPSLQAANQAAAKSKAGRAAGADQAVSTSVSRWQQGPLWGQGQRCSHGLEALILFSPMSAHYGFAGSVGPVEALWVAPIV